MEVHAHTHTPRKKWTHYFWEFFMLFLAVFCGFLAENQREHFVEHQREKQYIRNLLQDLERDTSAINTEIQVRRNRSIWSDSLIKELSVFNNLINAGNIYFYSYSLTSIRVFGSSNATISQLKNSGNMRLIRQKDALDSINAYDIEVERYKAREEIERQILEDYRKAICYVLDANVLLEMEDSTTHPFSYKRPEIKISVISKDSSTLHLVKGLAAQLHTRNAVNIIGLKNLLRRAAALIKQLKYEYHLK